MASPTERDEEGTFGAYAHGGTSADRHLERQGTPVERGEPEDEPAKTSDDGGGALPASQAAQAEVPMGCADSKTNPG